MNNNDSYQIILLTSFEPCLYNFPCRTDYMQNEFTVDSEGGIELSSEDSDSDTETN